MTKRRLHQITRARALRSAPAATRPAYALFPRGRWDISGERRSTT